MQAVYGDSPQCFLTLSLQLVDAHHLLGRSYVHGFRPKNPDRKLFSSILNFVPLRRDIHDGPHRDSPEMRRLFLRFARKKVAEAVRNGSYELKQLDNDFLVFAEQWLAENPC